TWAQDILKISDNLPADNQNAQINERRGEIIRLVQSAWNDIDLKGSVFVPPGFEYELPNPVYQFDKICNQRPGRVQRSRIHGDLNLTNILIGVDGNYAPEIVFIIDLANSCDDAVTAQDFARMEAEFWVETFTEATDRTMSDEKRVAAFVKLQLKQPIECSSQLIKNAVAWVNGVRREAYNRLGNGIQNYKMEDYMWALYYHFLRTFTYKGTVQQSPFKCRMAFLGAALALRFLQDLKSGKNPQVPILVLEGEDHINGEKVLVEIKIPCEFVQFSREKQEQLLTNIQLMLSTGYDLKIVQVRPGGSTLVTIEFMKEDAGRLLKAFQDGYFKNLPDELQIIEARIVENPKPLLLWHPSRQQWFWGDLLGIPNKLLNREDLESHSPVWELILKPIITGANPTFAWGTNGTSICLSIALPESSGSVNVTITPENDPVTHRDWWSFHFELESSQIKYLDIGIGSKDKCTTGMRELRIQRSVDFTEIPPTNTLYWLYFEGLFDGINRKFQVQLPVRLSNKES
ncbi:MAG TPA: hypothetical protein VHY08_12600, partial [Bacillota bacterium]|nr:hypothetical protein [Bacillota bacterium]